MKQVVSCLLALTLCISGNLVWGDSEFDRWKQKQRGAFEGFVTARDREFAEYLRTSWREFQAHKALIREQTPKPKRQPRVPQLEASQGAMEPAPANSPFEPDSLERLLTPQPIPAAPKKNPATQPGTVFEQKSPQQEDLIRVGLYGSALRFSQAPGLRNVRLMQLQPDQFSETWLAFASADLQTTVEALRAQQRALVLPDWAVLQLVLKVARNEIGHSTTATAYSWYLLNQLGFDVRLGYNESELVLLMAANVTVYGRPFFTIDGERYYRVDGGPANNLRIHTAGFPGHGGKLRLDFANQMRTPGLVESRQLRFVDGGRIASAVIQYDPHWVEYLNGHPAIDLHHYFSAKVFSTTANSLAAFWQTRIQQDSPQQAVNRLLHFVQNGFKYQTDDEQFGGERYLLPSESIHYNAIDCEDRSFLLAWLIRDLLGLPVIGLHYPGHVALAVALPGEPVVGAATVDYEGRQYIVADPTYMGAALGQLMPQFEGVTPTILAVN